LAAGAGCFGLPAAEEAPSCFASRAERRTAGIDSGASDPQARTLDREYRMELSCVHQTVPCDILVFYTPSCY
jgi:hypothetical protein